MKNLKRFLQACSSTMMLTAFILLPAQAQAQSGGDMMLSLIHISEPTRPY